MRYGATQYLYGQYGQLTERPFEVGVGCLWTSILPMYFKLDEKFLVLREAQPWADRIAIHIEDIEASKFKGVKVMVFEEKPGASEIQDGQWTDAVNWATDYMKEYMKVSRFPKSGKMYAVVTIGRFSRFYELTKRARGLKDYTTGDGKPLDFKEDEEKIDRILMEWVRDIKGQ